MALEMSTRREGDVLIVTLDGELDIYTVAGFREQVDAATPPPRAVVFDLSSVTLLDSSGLGALVGVLNQAAPGGGRVGLACPAERLRNVFRVTGLDDAFVFADDVPGVQEALAAQPAPPADPQ